MPANAFGRLALVGTLLALSSACSMLERPVNKDPLAVSQRYSFRHKDQCPSWIQSHRTGYYYCASPPISFDFEADVVTARPQIYAPGAGAVAKGGADGKTDKDSLMAHGKTVYDATCAACHQATGMGIPGAFPPLKGAGGFYGSPKNHAGIIIHGLSGEIQVAGQTFNGVMPPQATLSDYDVAAVATFERHSWGNDDGIVLPEHAKAAREKK